MYYVKGENVFAFILEDNKCELKKSSQKNVKKQWKNKNH